nr:hypothetical protein [Tanacetum cinerariifolium]
TGRKMKFNGKEPIGFDKTKVECYNCHRIGHFSRDCRSAMNLENRSRDAGNAGYKRRDNGKRSAKEEDKNALVVQDELGYDSQFHEKEVLNIREEEVTETVFDNFSSDEENSLANDRPKPIPAKIDFVKAGESVKHVKPVDSVKHVNPVKSVKTAEQTEKSKHFSSSPKIDRKDWNGKMTQKLGLDSLAKKSVLLTNVGKGTGHRERRPVWNNVQRINHQNKFAPTSVFIRSSRIPVSVAKPKAAASTSAAKPVNTARLKQSVNFSKSRSTFHKLYSPIRRSFYNATSHSKRNSTERVNTVGSKAVSVVKGNWVTTVKTSAGSSTTSFKEKGIVDSRCSRHMTGNKAYLTNYQEIHDGGFVAFGSSRGKISGK